MDRLPCCQGNRVNAAFCGPAHDTILSNRNTEKLNFETNYITRLYAYRRFVSFDGARLKLYTQSFCFDFASLERVQQFRFNRVRLERNSRYTRHLPYES